MKGRYLEICSFVIGILTTNICCGQIILNAYSGFKGLKFNYSTRDDVVKAFGKDYIYLPDSYAPDLEASNINGYKKNSEIIYKNIGISFILDDDNEIVNYVVLSAPFTGITDKGFRIELGKTTFKDILNYLNEDSLDISTTGNSIYWAFSF